MKGQIYNLHLKTTIFNNVTHFLRRWRILH